MMCVWDGPPAQSILNRSINDRSIDRALAQLIPVMWEEVCVMRSFAVWVCVWVGLRAGDDNDRSNRRHPRLHDGWAGSALSSVRRCFALAIRVVVVLLHAFQDTAPPRSVD